MSVQKSLRVAHTSSVLISLVVNGLLIAALFTFITISDQQDQQATTVMVMDPVEREEIEEPEEEPEEVEIEQLDDLEVFDDFVMDDPLDTDIEPMDQPVEQPTETSVNNLSELMSDISSPVQMRGLMIGRSSAGRQAALRQYGRGLGGVSEPAVMNALRWLKENQNPDGSWSYKELNGKANAGVTGLALLTFLAHGETPSSKEFGATVSRGIRFLVENQDARGIFQPAGAHTSYGHAIATYALAEAYTMTENILFREPLERGLKVLYEGQQPNGGYDYGYKLSNRNDLSVGAWHVQALKAASIALDRDPEVVKFMNGAMDGMMEGAVKRDNGLGFTYTVNNGKASGTRRIITAAGLLGLHLSGRGDSGEAKDVFDYLDDFADRGTLPEWGVARVGNEYGGEIMFWYYAVQAFFQENRDGQEFGRFYTSMVKALVQNQATDGHWLCFSRGKEHGPVFNTTLAALGLMVTYRYLPTTQAENIMPASQQPSRAPAQEEETVEFNI